jgi:hypothetical protein
MHALGSYPDGAFPTGVDLPLFSASGVLYTAIPVETRRGGMYTNGSAGDADADPTAGLAPITGGSARPRRDGQAVANTREAQARLRMPRLERQPISAASPMSRGVAGTYNDAHPAPLRDFVYNLRKLRKCLHLYLAETPDRGVGVFAAREFSRGDVVMMDFDGDYYDQVLNYRELCRRGIDLKYPLQVGLDLFKVPSGNIDDFINHSCDPTTGVRLYRSGMIILAIQQIKMHDEITFDYATYLNNSHERIICRCGSSNCRGVIGNFSTLPADLQQRYLDLGIAGDFVLKAAPREDGSP